MPETAYSSSRYATRSASYGALLTQTMFLVAVAIGFFVAGSYVGADLSRNTAFGLTIAAVVVLFAQNFIPAARTGPFGMGVLFVVASLLGPRKLAARPPRPGRGAAPRGARAPPAARRLPPAGERRPP